jgi:hypothetical protein
MLEIGEIERELIRRRTEHKSTSMVIRTSLGRKCRARNREIGGATTVRSPGLWSFGCAGYLQWEVPSKKKKKLQKSKENGKSFKV